MSTTFPITNGQIFNSGDSVIIGPWRLLADLDGRRLRFQTYQGGVLYEDNAVLFANPTTTSWTFTYENVGGSNRQLTIFDSSNNRLAVWIAKMPTVINWAARGLNPVGALNATEFRFMAFGSEEIVATITGNGIIICFHPKCQINKKRADQYQIGDQLDGADGRKLTIIDIIHSGVPDQFVSFPPNSFKRGVPSKEVLLTKGHYLQFNNEKLPAITWHNKRGKGVLKPCNDVDYTIHFITDGPEILNFVWCNDILVDTMGRRHPWYQNIRGLRNRPLKCIK